MVGGVGLAQLVVGQGQHAGDVHRHVAVADHHGALGREVEVVVGVVGMRRCTNRRRRWRHGCRAALRPGFPATVGLAADREDDRVVEPLEVLDLEVVTHLDVAEEAESVAGRGFFVDPDHRLDLRMIRGDAAANQAERGGQAIEEIDLSVQVLALEDVLGGVEAGGAGADDGDAQRVLFGSDLAHGERERIGNSGRQASTRRAASRCSRDRCRGSAPAARPG